MWPWAFSFCFLTRDQLAESAIFVWVWQSRQNVVSQHVHRSALAFGYPVRIWIFFPAFLQLEGTNAYSAFLSRNRSLQWFGHSPETQELLCLRHCSVRECSGSHIWEPHKRPLDSLARSCPKPWLHTQYQWVWWQWLQLTLTECLLNARHPHRTTDVLVPLSHKCGNWGREL